MKRYWLCVLLFLGLATFGCTRDEMPGWDNGGATDEDGSQISNDDKFFKQGVMTVKLTPEAAEVFTPVITRSGVSTGVTSIDALAGQFNVTKIERTFRYGGRHEPRMRAEGLHLWYNIYFDESAPMTRALADFSGLSDFQIVERVPRIKRIETGRPVTVSPAQIQALAATRAGDDIPRFVSDFDDPLLNYQWHYHNEGILDGAKPGADINLLKAWEIETGKPEVIVAIIDGGIQTDHPDLMANLWVNTAEKNGTAGEDDDNNGFIDDIHGYNFVSDKGAISPHDHGTHVAGTVGAVNNNGIGLGGVAGGNGTPNSGIRLMSCQIFETDSDGNDRSLSEENRQEVFLYAAHNGAVIAQNSWTYGWTGVEEELLASDKAAIDYFIKYAGTESDPDNPDNLIQTGPMKGGIVIFATGNDYLNKRTIPASYSEVFSVASFQCDYQKAAYSNYGTWVHVTAPGGHGDYTAGTQVFSTMTDNQYGFLDGTSMACPHVSGIAALVVSHFGVGTDGFTPADLKERLLAGTNETIRWFNPAAWPMGKGYINAYKALAYDSGSMSPDRVGDITVDWSLEDATVRWRVTADPDHGKADHYLLVVSPENTTGIDFTRPIPSRFTVQTIQVISAGVGDELSVYLPAGALEKNRTYYVSIAGVNADGRISLSSTVSGSLVENRPPQLLDAVPEISIRKTDKTVYSYSFQVADPEGFAWTFTFRDAPNGGATMTRTGDILTLSVSAQGLARGTYDATLTLTDEQGLSNTITLSYSITSYAPELVKPLEDVLFQGTGLSESFDLSDYFKDKDGDVISYRVSSSNPTAISAALSGTVLTVTAQTFGTATIHVVASDPDTQTTASFGVVCRDGNMEVDLYPVPVKTDGILNIRMGEHVKGTISVSLFTMAGARVFHQDTAIAPDSPAQVNLSKLGYGSYRVVVEYKGEKITRNIIKL